MNLHGNSNGRTNGAGKPRRVLFVDSQAELGGAGFALLTMLQYLDRRLIEPFYVCMTPAPSESEAHVRAMGVPALHIPAGRFRDWQRTAQAIRALHKLIREQQIDAVLTNSGHPLFFARPAALAAGRPCAWWVHGYEPRDPLRGHGIALAQQFLQADAMFANSEFTARMLVRDFPNETRIRVVRYGIDLQAHRPDPAAGLRVRASLGIPPVEPVAGIFGRLQRWKGQHVFLEAAARMAARGVACRFLVAGNSMFGLEPEYAEELQHFVEKNSLRDRVMFLGHRRDVNDVMNACDVVLHASIEPEPWGLVVAEGMAAGRPVIASAAGGPLEMIDHGRTGLLIPPGEARELATALEELLRQPERRQEMGEAARRHAAEAYNPVEAAAVLARELLQMCQSRPRENGNHVG
jgi:glycosyltransferase involved in cell wall biosynthesis